MYLSGVGCLNARHTDDRPHGGYCSREEVDCEDGQESDQETSKLFHTGSATICNQTILGW